MAVFRAGYAGDQQPSAEAGPLVIDQQVVDRKPLAPKSVGRSQLASGISVSGLVFPYAGSVVPAGWLLCDGSAVSRAKYAALFAAIGTTWGVGDGSSTFNLPDLRGRSLLGAGTGSGLTARTLGAKGGEETHVLTEAELAAHSHGGVTGGESATHTHPQAPQTAVTTSSTVGLSPTVTNQAAFSAAFSTGTESNGHTHTVASDGSNTGHNNMPPWAAVNWIVAT